jgi:putative endonuclease
VCGHAPLKNDLDARIAAHNAGKGAKYTASRLPVQTVYTEPVDSKSAAMRRETQIKRWTKAKKEALIAGNRQKLRRLSKRKTCF